VAGFGRGDHGRTVFWVDYATAISMHPVITGNRKERRLERIFSPDPEEHRITYGCINVPPGFYQNVVVPTFTGSHPIVYVLPDTRSVDEVFPTLAGPPAQTAGEAHASAGGAER
jgi:hypothetical protein